MKLVRKWFSFKSKNDELHIDNDLNGVYGGSVYEREPPAIKKTKTEKSSRSNEGRRWGRANLDDPQIINVQNYSIFSATWNVGGKSPSSKMNLDDWLHAAPPADIYVLGFQEIVPLNAANILGAEDNGPAKKWLSLIRKTLNNRSNTSGGNYTPSPVIDPVAEYDADFEGSTRQKNQSFYSRRSFQVPRNENEPHLDRRYSVCDRAMFGQRPSDCSSSHRPSDFSSSGHRQSDYSNYRPSDYSASYRPSDYSANYRPSDYSGGYRPSDYSGGYRPSDYSASHRPSNYSWSKTE